MILNRRLLAGVEWLLLTPAALFLIAVVARPLQLVGHEPGSAAQVVVGWYSARLWTLWVLLVGLPLGALIAGCAALLGAGAGAGATSRAGQRPSLPLNERVQTAAVAVATLAAALILAIVILHMLAN